MGYDFEEIENYEQIGGRGNQNQNQKKSGKPKNKAKKPKPTKPKPMNGGSYDSTEYHKNAQNGGGNTLSDFDWVSVANLAIPFALLWSSQGINKMPKLGKESKEKTSQKGGNYASVMYTPNTLLNETMKMLGQVSN